MHPATGTRGVFFFMELQYVKLTETPSFVRKRKREISDNEKEVLLKAYSDYQNKLLESSKEKIGNYQQKLNLWNSKTCYCGGKLRYITGFDFWGCENYKDKSSSHITFQGKNATVYPISFLVSVNWVTEILQSAGLRGEITPKDCYKFFIQSGLEDLRIKYGFRSTEENMMTFIKAKSRSQEQEDLALSYLQTVYDKVLYQQCITFKEVGKKESFCIPDFIVSSEFEVKIVDAKLDYANDKKMDKYVELISFLMRQKEDLRPVSGAHIMYEKSVSEYFKSKHELITIPDCEYMYNQD